MDLLAREVAVGVHADERLIDVGAVGQPPNARIVGRSRSELFERGAEPLIGRIDHGLHRFERLELVDLRILERRIERLELLHEPRIERVTPRLRLGEGRDDGDGVLHGEVRRRDAELRVVAKLLDHPVEHGPEAAQPRDVVGGVRGVGERLLALHEHGQIRVHARQLGDGVDHGVAAGRDPAVAARSGGHLQRHVELLDQDRAREPPVVVEPGRVDRLEACDHARHQLPRLCARLEAGLIEAAVERPAGHRLGHAPFARALRARLKPLDGEVRDERVEGGAGRLGAGFRTRRRRRRPACGRVRRRRRGRARLGPLAARGAGERDRRDQGSDVSHLGSPSAERDAGGPEADSDRTRSRFSSPACCGGGG